MGEKEAYEHGFAEAREAAAKTMEFQIGNSLETPFDRSLVDGGISVIRALRPENTAHSRCDLESENERLRERLLLMDEAQVELMVANAKLDTSLTDLRYLLAAERDEFGRKETELWQQIKRLKQKKEARK